MDTLTSKHGLAALKPSQPIDQADVETLSPELQQELDRLQDLFTVDVEKLKQISQRFEEELQDGEPDDIY